MQVRILLLDPNHVAVTDQLRVRSRIPCGQSDGLTRYPSGEGALCKSANAGSIPALVSKLQWLERRGTDLLNRRCWFESSLELHFTTRRVNWAGAQRRLLSDRPAHR